jgi:hypothetical protein
MLKRYAAFIIGAVVLLFLPLAVIRPLRDLSVRAVRPIGHFLTTRNLAIRNFWLNLTTIGSRKLLKTRVCSVKTLTFVKSSVLAA